VVLGMIEYFSISEIALLIIVAALVIWKGGGKPPNARA
jgi:hypothetical protein